MCSPIPHGYMSAVAAKKQAEAQAEHARLKAGGKPKEKRKWPNPMKYTPPQISYGWWIFWILIIYWFVTGRIF